MRTKVHGSLLIEYVIYSGIVCLLLLAILQCAGLFYTHMQQMCLKKEEALQALNIMTLLRDDIWQAPLAITSWIRTEEGTSIWRSITQNYDIGWVLQKDELYRIQGSYNDLEKKWMTAHKALIARSVLRFSILPLPIMDQQGTGIRVTCSMVFGLHKKVFTWSIVPRT